MGRLTHAQDYELQQRLEQALREHNVGETHGGTAVGSTWECLCGEKGTVNGTRGMAYATGQAHVAEKIAELLRMTPSQIDRHVSEYYSRSDRPVRHRI